MDLPYACVVKDGEPTFVLIPIDEYKRLVNADMIESAQVTLDDPNVEWVDADQLALQIAGNRITRARKSRGMTQKQLAAKLKVPQSQVSRIERNPDHTTVRTLKKIAKALDVDVSALL
ncbi:MAG: helix-turn-helix domain-containing protein [Phycisphaerales bacterium]|nr:helix-turn-helix domain-containing protein [Phycisphaerales bacterium]